MKVFVVGSTGFLGHGTVDALLQAGHEVRCLARALSVNKIPHRDEVEHFLVDFANSGRLAQGIEGCDAVFNLAGIIREFPKRRTTFKKVHIDYTRNLVEACAKAGVKRYMHMSALGVDTGLEIGYNTSKMAAEKIVRESALDWTIFRPSLIFGPGDRFAVEFAGWIQKHIPVPVIGKGDYRLMPVGRTDLCDGMVKLLGQINSYGKIYNIGGPEKLTYIEILDILEKHVRTKKIMIKLPAGLIMFVAGIMGRFQFFPASKDMIKQLLKESVTDDASFWQDTGIIPRTLNESLADYVK